MIALMEHREVLLEPREGAARLQASLSMLRAQWPRLFAWDLVQARHVPVGVEQEGDLMQFSVSDPAGRGPRTRYWLLLYGAAVRRSPDVRVELLIGPTSEPVAQRRPRCVQSLCTARSPAKPYTAFPSCTEPTCLCQPQRFTEATSSTNGPRRHLADATLPCHEAGGGKRRNPGPAIHPW